MKFMEGKKCVICGGGGVFFFWQAGVVKALQQQYDLRNEDVCFSGASAGSISSILAVCNVNIDDAIEEAMRLADQAEIFRRRGGLLGIWGGLIERWLNFLLPENCHLLCSGRVFISLTKIPSLRRIVVSKFTSKNDLIQACLCSVHIPYFLDGKFSRMYNGDAYIDGSVYFFIKNKPWVVSEAFTEERDAFILHHTRDYNLMKRKWRFLETLSKDALVEMVALGFDYGMRRIRTRVNLNPPTPLDTLAPASVHYDIQ
jgi:predicted patatin/cPLA2 family phospholipase